MKIAHLSAHYRPVIGGQEVYIANLIEVCRNHGHESVVVQPNRGENGPDTVTLPRLPYLARFIPGIDRKLLNIMVSALKPEQLYNADAIISHYAFHAKPLESVRHKTIILSHGVEWRVNHKTSYDLACEANAKRCLGRFNHVVNDTHYLRQLGINVPPAVGYFSEIAPGVWFIPNCVDTEHFVPGPGLPEYKDRNIILVPRQMVEARGIHLAIAAFKIIADEYPDFEMCLLGKRHKAASQYIARLDQMIATEGLQDRIHFRDPVANRQMPLWFNSAKVVLVPTLEKEGTSLSAIEGMSCGVPTVTTNVAGLADLPTVQCFPKADSMAEALRLAVRDGRQIGNQQRRAACEIFNMRNWSQGWIDAFDSLNS